MAKVKGENIDCMHFVSPYTTTNRIRRMVWGFCWTLLARPFPKSMLMPWKRFYFVCLEQRLQVLQMCMLRQEFYALEFRNERPCLHSIGSRLL